MLILFVGVATWTRGEARDVTGEDVWCLFTKRRLALYIGKEEREDVVDEVRVGSELNGGGMKEKSVTGKKRKAKFLSFLFCMYAVAKQKYGRTDPIQLRSVQIPQVKSELVSTRSYSNKTVSNVTHA